MSEERWLREALDSASSHPPVALRRVDGVRHRRRRRRERMVVGTATLVTVLGVGTAALVSGPPERSADVAVAGVEATTRHRPTGVPSTTPPSTTPAAPSPAPPPPPAPPAPPPPPGPPAPVGPTGPPAPPAPTAAPAPAPPSAPSADLDVEAESGVLDEPMRVRDDGGASGGRYVLVPDDEQDGQDEAGGDRGGWVEVAVTVPADGRYAVWGRIRSPDGGSNSFWVSIDGGPEVKWHVPGPTGSDTAPDWTWVAVRDAERSAALGVTLAPGRHVVRVRSRDDGAELDRVVLSADPGFVPPG